MTYSEAIKRPFQDIKTLIIGIIVCAIPIVNFAGMGYLLECAKTTRGKLAMPKWESWGHLFVRGLIALVISIIYLIPLSIVLGLTLGTAFLTAMTSMNTMGYVSLTGLAGVGIVGVLISFVVALITFYLLPSAIVRYAEKGTFSSAFEIKDIYNKVATGQYFAAWLVAMVYGIIVNAIVGVILGPVPLLGAGVSMFVVGVAVFTMIANAYNKV